MKKHYWGIICLILALLKYTPVYSSDSATPEEVVKKVNEAVAYIAKEGDRVFPEFNDPNGKWVWGGTYVFIMKCKGSTELVTHPIKPKMIGQDLSGLKDKNGNYFFIQLCEMGSTEKGGWVEYLWPKPEETNPSRKISFCRQIPGTPYQAGAGIYDEKVSMETLKKLIE